MRILILLLVLATYFDFKSFKIPNWFILTSYLVGLVYQALTGSCLQIFSSMCNVIIIWIFTVPLFTFHVIGGGDCKLFSVCGLFTGVVRTLSIGIYAFVFAGIICILWLAFRWRNFKEEKEHKIHFSIYILLGVVCEYVWGVYAWNIGF